MARLKVQVPIEQTEQVEQQSAIAEPELAQAPVMPPPRLSLSRGNFFILALIGLVLIIVVVLLNDRKQLKDKLDKLSTTQTAATSSDVQKYQEEIGKIVELPAGQMPSLISVKDAKKLSSENSFFKNAQDDDVVLLYVLPDKSVRAILYRPSTKKVIEATSSATVGTGTPAPSPN